MTVAIGSLIDLELINQVIDDAVMSWPVSERNKRLSVPVLRYDQQDFRQYRFLLYKDVGRVVGVAAWDAENMLVTVNGCGHLLHGLYIAPSYQGRGYGRRLMEEVFLASEMLGADGLLVKAQKVAVGFFRHCGLTVLPAQDSTDYPYMFWYQRGHI